MRCAHVSPPRPARQYDNYYDHTNFYYDDRQSGRGHGHSPPQGSHRYSHDFGYHEQGSSCYSGSSYSIPPQTHRQSEPLRLPKEHSYEFYQAQDYIREQYERYRREGGLLQFLRWQEMVSPAVPPRWRQRYSDHYNDPSRRYQQAPGRFGYN